MFIFTWLRGKNSNTSISYVELKAVSRGPAIRFELYFTVSVCVQLNKGLIKRGFIVALLQRTLACLAVSRDGHVNESPLANLEFQNRQYAESLVLQLRRKVCVYTVIM